ncbi:MAG: sodium-dependent transporter [Synergistaceae bacterium]|nr:sodium-dependent transporter [Synergistaceae bacterium]
MSNEREQWGSKFGFVMAAAGSAVGLGNIWKFPYLAGVNGGAAFVVVYLLIVLFIGFTVMLAELAIGRASRKNAVGSFAVLSRNPLWQIVGWAGVICGFVILSYYGVVGGWAIKYMVASFTDLIPVAETGGAGGYLDAFFKDVPQVIMYQVIFMGLTILIVAGGIGEGIERACKVMMPALFVILLILIVRSVTLPGAEKGIEYYLKPDFSKINAMMILTALGQVFFSLSLGMGCMITYGSYFRKEENLANSALLIVSMDTAIAFLAGLAIFPAVFALGGEPAAGPGLTFVTLPGVFAKMAAGTFFSFAFFLLLFFAAITSAISLLEVVVAYFKDELGWGRVVASWLMGLLITALGVPSAMAVGTGKPEIFGLDFESAMEFLSDKILMPLGGIFIALFAGWMMVDKIEKEVTSDGLHRVGYYTAWLWLARVIAPIAMAIIFIQGLGLLDKFFE